MEVLRPMNACYSFYTTHTYILMYKAFILISKSLDHYCTNGIKKTGLVQAVSQILTNLKKKSEPSLSALLDFPD